MVSVLDVGDDDRGPFLVMDFVEGVAAVVESSHANHTRLPPRSCSRWRFASARRRLGHAAHELLDADGASLGLVHRDVFPYNILLGFDGSARVTDFGSPRRSAVDADLAGILKGKLGYMAPEQLRFRAQDRRSDLFSLGVVLFELLTSTRLYPGTAPEKSAQRILEEPPPDLLDSRDDAPPELVGLIFKLLAKSAEHRPSDARAVARTLEAILNELMAERDCVDTSEYLERQFGEDRRRLRGARSGARPAGFGDANHRFFRRRKACGPGCNQAPFIALRLRSRLVVGDCPLALSDRAFALRGDAGQSARGLGLIVRHCPAGRALPVRQGTGNAGSRPGARTCAADGSRAGPRQAGRRRRIWGWR